MPQDPSDCVHDEYREKDLGVISMPSNSKPATSNFYVDRSRLGVHDEYDPDVKNEWGGKGKFVLKPNRIVDNARSAVPGSTTGSSFRNINAPAEPTNSGPCCTSPYDYRQQKKARGGE